MSARCQIQVNGNGRSVMLYHHDDGCFSGVGMEIKSVLDKMPRDYDVEDFLRRLMKIGGYEIVMFDREDLEYFYLIDFDQKIFEGYAFDHWMHSITGANVPILKSEEKVTLRK